jgi:4-hydroxy-tetrahydrodipicolinate reductase
MAKIIIHGSKGRMGQMLIACGESMDGIEIVAGVDEGDDLSTLIADCDAVIDFSLHSASADCAVLCAKHGKAFVIGTTGHSDTENLQSLIINQKSQSSGPAIIQPA